MILTDYLRATPDLTWDIARQCGVTQGTIRLPEDDRFDVTSLSDLRTVIDRFQSAGIKPIIVEPLPNELHDHIKIGDEKRDWAIERFIALMKNMHEVGLETVCFNFMAHYGWTRTKTDIPERGDALVTGFKLADFKADDFALTEEALWDNYFYFINAVLPYAEKYQVKLALHPDDPPLPKLGNTARIFTSLNAIEKGIRTIPSEYLGVTFCQACYWLMGESIPEAVERLKDRIFFIHFRNVRGEKTDFSETFHDNGMLPMAEIMKLYKDHGINVPVRVDHVPTMQGEKGLNAGYDALGRLYAIGYLKGILEALDINERR